MNRETCDRWCERGILGLMLAILVFGPLGFGAVRAFEFAIIISLTVGVMGLWVVRLWLNPKPQCLWPPICWAVLAFTSYAIGRYLTADIEYVARQELLRVVVYAFLFFAIINNLHRKESTQIITFTLLFVAMAISGYAIYQFATGSTHVWLLTRVDRYRGSGTYVCPNHLGGFLEMLLPLGLAYALIGRVKPVTRILLGYASLVILAGIASTVSRGSWLATSVELILFFSALLLMRSYQIPALVILTLLITAGFFFYPRSTVVRMRWRQLVTSEGKVNDDMRFALWGPAVEMWRENPWWGVGPAHFDSRFRAYRPEGVQTKPDRVHNDYLNTLVDWGVVGASLVLLALLLLGVGVAKTWRYVRPSNADLGGKVGSNKYAFVLGASLGLVAILVHSVVDFNMHIPANAILAVTLMSLLSAHIRFATERFWFKPGLFSKTLITAVALAGSVYLGRQAWRSYSEFVLLEQGARAPAFSPAAIQLFTKAFAVEPMNPNTAFLIGEALSRESREGGTYYKGQEGVDYRRLAEQAMQWFSIGRRLDPYESRNYSGYGWCLDWLDRSAESGPFYQKAEQMDPNNYFNLCDIGSHYIQLGDFAAARPFFERSLRLQWEGNLRAESYLSIVNARLLESATNEFSSALELPLP